MTDRTASAPRINVSRRRGDAVSALATLSVQRLAAAGVLAAFVPLAGRLTAVAALSFVALVLWSLLLYETVRFADARRAVRNGTVRPR